jgi:hypothetical protein
MNNPLFNCYPAATEPNLASFSHFEIDPVEYTERGCQTVRTEPWRATIWTVYGRNHFGECEALSDWTTRKLALAAAFKIRRMAAAGGQGIKQIIMGDTSTAPKDMRARIVIEIEGGLVRTVATDCPALARAEWVILDRDTSGMDVASLIDYDGPALAYDGRIALDPGLDFAALDLAMMDQPMES